MTESVLARVALAAADADGAALAAVLDAADGATVAAEPPQAASRTRKTNKSGADARVTRRIAFPSSPLSRDKVGGHTAMAAQGPCR